MSETVTVQDLDIAIEEYKALGYLVDMIFPADNPREALVSRGDERLRLRTPARSKSSDKDSEGSYPVPASARADWIRGRAGMEYRDLIPERLGGKLIASHIRLTAGGEVPDYVHYHKIDFQLIYCKRGRIRVVYEDQGPPFWLETGDCVLQPPEIRHRVLECTAGAEVIEITMPAEHETWVEHELTLPNSEIRPERSFGGQRFVTSRAANVEGEGPLERDLGIHAATDGRFDARGIRTTGNIEDNRGCVVVEIGPKEYLKVSFAADSGLDL